MKRKNLLPVLLFAFSATLLLLIVSLQGNFFKSSLIENTTASGFEMPSLAGSGEVLSTLTLDDARTRMYRANIMASVDQSKGLGVYFPSIYTTSSVSGSFALPLAYEGIADRQFGKSMEVTLSYPSSFLSYAGATSVTNSFGTLTVDTQTRQNSLSFVFTPTASGTVLPATMSSFLSIPFTVKEGSQLSPTAAFAIETVAMTELDGTMTSLPFVKGNNSLVSFTALTNSNINGRPVMTRPVVTSEVRTNTNVNTTPSSNLNINLNTNTSIIPAQPVQPTQVNRRPYVTADETRLSPGSVREQSGDTIFMYVSVADPDGHGDIRSVLANLSEFGFGSSTPLLKIETNPTYAVYATSFVLQNTVKGSDLPKAIPFTVTDTANNITMGTLTIIVKAAQNTAPVTVVAPTVNTNPQATAPTTTQTSSPRTNTNVNTNPTSSSTANFAADFDGDGDVDSNDLKTYINIYEKEINR